MHVCRCMGMKEGTSTCVSAEEQACINYKRAFVHTSANTDAHRHTCTHSCARMNAWTQEWCTRKRSCTHSRLPAHAIIHVNAFTQAIMCASIENPHKQARMNERNQRAHARTRADARARMRACAHDYAHMHILTQKREHICMHAYMHGHKVMQPHAFKHALMPCMPVHDRTRA